MNRKPPRTPGAPRNRTQEHALEEQRRSVGSTPEGVCPDPREREQALHAPQPQTPAQRRRRAPGSSNA